MNRLKTVLYHVQVLDLAHQLGDALCRECEQGKCAEVAKNGAHSSAFLHRLTRAQRKELERRAVNALMNSTVTEVVSDVLFSVVANAVEEWGLDKEVPS